MSIVDAGWTYAWPQDWSVAPASPGPFARALEHRESTEAARPEAGGEPAEVPPSEAPTAPIDVDDEPRRDVRAEDPTEPDIPERREHELLRINGIPADSYPFLPTSRVNDVFLRECRQCGSFAVDRLRVHPRVLPAAQCVDGESCFVEFLCSSCA